MRKPLVILLSILMLVAIGVTVYFMTTYEIRTEQKETRLESWEVLKNQYLAAEHFLKKKGKTVEIPKGAKFFRLFSEKNSEKNTIIMLGKIDNLSYEQEDKVLDWVRSGGTLILEAEIESEILEDMNIYVARNTASNQTSDLYVGDQKIARLDFKQNLSITKDDEEITFARQAFAEMPKPTKDTKPEKVESGHTYVAFNYGKGTIHLLSTGMIWNNHNIDSYDHAWFLDDITTENVTIIKLRSSEGSGLSKVLRALVDHFLYTMIGIILVIALILWNQGMRFGAIEEEVSRDRRTLSEYLKALANFYQQEKGYGNLIITLQAEIEARMKVRHHAYQSLSEEEQYLQLSLLTQVSVETINLLMSKDIETQKISTLQFIKRVAELQKIRNKL